MRIDWWTLLLQAVNALVLVWLLARFLFRPVARIVADRQSAASAMMADAAAAKAAADEARRRAADDAARVEAGRARLLDAAASEAQQLKARLEEDARTGIAALHAQAQADIDAARQTARRADAERASAFALEIAARLFDRLDPSARVAGFVESLARALAALPEAERRQIAASGAPLQLSAPRPLDEAEALACRERLAHVLGYEPDVRFDVDPTLIAGLELRASHVVVRDSLRGDLERLRAELLAGDCAHD